VTRYQEERGRSSEDHFGKDGNGSSDSWTIYETRLRWRLVLVGSLYPPSVSPKADVVDAKELPRSSNTGLSTTSVWLGT
jgi:hypothetical protein